MEQKGKKQLKLYHGVIMILLAGVCVFYISPMLGRNWGLYGTLLNEILLLVLAVVFTVATGGDLRRTFPIQRPKLAAIFGTVILWIGTFLSVMIVTMFIAYFFPTEVMSVSQGLSMEFASLSFLIAFGIVSISPAICEEAVFRGVVLRSFSSCGNKWAAIIATGLIFGAFHGNIWRFVPTALLGIMLGYIVYETNNMIYAALFHAVNNAVPLISLFAMKALYSNEMLRNQMMTAEQVKIPLMSIGMYVMYGAAIPFLLYIGNHLIHKGQGRYEKALFGKTDKMTFIVLLGISFGFLMIGFAIIAVSFLVDRTILQTVF